MPALRLLLVVASLCLALCEAAAAQGARSVFLEELTWTELRDDIRAGKTTIIVPVGGTEQSGPHMALGKHNVRAKVLAGRIAEGLGNALVAPVIAYVPEGSIEPPAGHMKFAGTISIPEGAFETTLEYAARSFHRHGFRDIVLIGDHGGYQGDLAAVAARLNREWAGGPVRVHFIPEYYKSSADSYGKVLREHGLTAAQIGTHAGTGDTSLALAVDPRLIRADRLSAEPTVGDGLAGDPRPSTAALGQLGVDLIVARTVAAIKRAVGTR
jgi:creatinine amidohydrolase